MSTITPTIIDEASAFTTAGLNTAVTGITDGYNAIDTDDIADKAFGHENLHTTVPAKFPTPATAITAGSVAITVAYPGYGVTSGWTAVTVAAVDVSVVALTPFEVGPNSVDNIGFVLVGASFIATCPAANDGHLAIGVKHTGSAGLIEAIPGTDFKVGSLGNYTIEYAITENEIPAGEDLEEIWLLASGPNTVTVTTGQLWALPIHSEG